MRGESYFLGMRGPGHYDCILEDGGLFLLYSIDRDKDIKRCFAEEDFHEITDFNDLPNSLFACNVHQSVFEGEDSKTTDKCCLAGRRMAKDEAMLEPLDLIPISGYSPFIAVSFSECRIPAASPVLDPLHIMRKPCGCQIRKDLSDLEDTLREVTACSVVAEERKIEAINGQSSPP
ncbi:phospholysine phosphohistidine inorganic pyrophosphate phosphatase [Platysternon megacephalum]|uniref:Phospholysine phosphohistidine inorganic pyrophosphate phosphatase n=1 Tax=Platysternon megacephalum TaxID=55544 RepID=A0A4D9EN85_9SAUR|nr:phospholysine phosphohistidine inorganic pyrophosphate phosphatase [Platysternon megacephalum]